MEMQTKNKTAAKSTQSFLKLEEIRDDLVVMKDGTLRAILAVSSTNFDLKSEEEQNGIIYAYQRFLNSLEFPVQIVMQSRRMDIADYLGKLSKLAERQTNELLKVQTSEYTAFIQKLIENANIMEKNFYIVIPYSVSLNPQASGFFARLFGSSASKQATQKLESLKKHEEFLDQRVNSVSSSLSGLSLKAIRLKTAELIELYYNSYNFESGPLLDGSKLGDIKIMQSDEQKNWNRWATLIYE